MRSMVAGPQKVTTFSGCSAFEANSVQFSSSVVSDSLRPHGLQHPQASLSRSEGWKSFMSGCLMSGPQIKKKNHHFEVSSSLIPHNNNKPFLDGLWCEAKRGFYMTTGNDQLSSWTKKKLQSTFQSQTCTEKRWCSLYGGLLPVWSTTAFWIPVKPLLLRRALSKSMRCTKNCNAWSQHWSTKMAQFFSTTTSNGMSHNQRFKVEWNGLWGFASSTIFTWPLVNWLPLLQVSR